VLVCPKCRNENQEDARFCKVCGRALEPVHIRLEGQREADETAVDMDLPPVKKRGALPLVLGLVVLATVLVLGGVWYAARPNPCEGKFSSVLFGYCAEIPEGWRGGSQVEATVDVDQFVPPADEAFAQVRVREVVDPATQTQQYAQQFRISQEARGLEPSRLEGVDLDGEQALAWEVFVPTEDGDVVRARQVVIVREDGAWQISLYANETDYSNVRPGFEELLATWTWK
jgi:hypothetical protein